MPKESKPTKKEQINIGQLIEEIVKDALAKKASDIHFEPHETEMIVRYRIDGLLREVRKIEKDDYSIALSKLDGICLPVLTVSPKS